ncbi:MAG: hypothetical protein SFH39_10815 [Candidatus Magnetobacterium sp. LHC-1]|uniref:Stage 0 sporulation protein A homolog n=1 Tax=Candidatus Magnetobacterium casense TaxID=1455061 RepID=A0ABS6RWT5_9BACT|nr:hypothetical protein [Candidatus Magnetobacterium casensis]MBF0607089.1 hypothetical protein [Nitrospirota bacterium]MBV6341099.1 hypothetical protein [Candidatus Magnetobacterium casensis]
MAVKQMFVCCRKSIYQQLSLIFKEYNKQVEVRYFGRTADLEEALGREEDCCMLMLDAVMEKRSIFELAIKIKQDNPAINTLLLVSSDTTKDELVEVIDAKAVCGVLLIPFTSSQVEDYITRICCLDREEEENPLTAKKNVVRTHKF